MDSIFDCTAIGKEPFRLRTGEAVDIPVYQTRFDAATKRIRFHNDLYDIKPQLVLDGEVLLAELLIVRLLERRGWKGVWIDNFKNKRWRQLPVYGHPALLCERLESLLQRIAELNGRRAGTFDVLAWRGPTIAFLESKGPGDAITGEQRAWFASAVAAGVAMDVFGIVEWDYVDPTIATKGELKGRRKQAIQTVSRTRRKPGLGGTSAGMSADTPTGGGAFLPGDAGPRELALADRLPPAVVGSIIRAGYTLCTAQALDSDGTAFPSRIRRYLKPEGGLNAQGRAARDEVRRLGFKLTP